jgi:hypothetical protein
LAAPCVASLDRMLIFGEAHQTLLPSRFFPFQMSGH